MIFDWDDQCDEWNALKYLDELKQINQKFKATLFVIPKKTSMGLWMKMAKRSWLELVPHGYDHHDNYECSEWSADKMNEYINGLANLNMYLVKGFKAPGWQISDGCYEALLKRGYWVADQPYNNDRRPKELPFYAVGGDSWHGHTWNCVGNGIEETFEQLKKLVEETHVFKFVSEEIRANFPDYTYTKEK